MIGTFGGPLAYGKYLIRNDGLALHLSSIIDKSPVTMQMLMGGGNGSDKDIWCLEDGEGGYKIRNEASGTYLTYTPYAIPRRLDGQPGHVCASSVGAATEWKLVQTSPGSKARTFELCVIAGPGLTTGNDLSLRWDHTNYLHLRSSAEIWGTSFTFEAVGTTESLGVSTLVPADRTVTTIRSAYYPMLLLDLHKGGTTPNSRVLGNFKHYESSQTWTFVKGLNGYKILNALSQGCLGTDHLGGGPLNNASAVAPANGRGEEWVFVPSPDGFEIQLASNPDVLLSLYNLETDGPAWIYLDLRPKEGPLPTTQQWVFIHPEKDLGDDDLQAAGETTAQPKGQSSDTDPKTGPATGSDLGSHHPVVTTDPEHTTRSRSEAAPSTAAPGSHRPKKDRPALIQKWGRKVRSLSCTSPPAGEGDTNDVAVEKTGR